MAVAEQALPRRVNVRGAAARLVEPPDVLEDRAV